MSMDWEEQLVRSRANRQIDELDRAVVTAMAVIAVLGVEGSDVREKTAAAADTAVKQQ